MLTQGTATHKAQQIAATIDGVGGELGAGSDADFAYVSAEVTADQLDLALGLMADVVLHPSFPADELERWRRKAASGLELQRANAGYLAEVAFQRAVYGTVLGGGSNGRLFQEIRRKRGLVYGAYSRFAEQLVTGSFAASTSTKTDSTIEALRLTLELVAAMGKTPVPKVELDEAKTFLNGGFPLEIETADDVAGRVLTTLSFGLGREFLDTYRDRIGALTA